MKHLRSFFAVLLAAAVCAAVVLFSGCGASVQVQQLTIPGERGSIHATLTTPANAENMPAVVICHGFTGSRQLDGHAKPLAKTLAQHGIASIAIDFAGSGESEEPFTAYTPANMRDDITSAITYLTDTVGADPERIGLLGHSMGSFYARQYLCEWGDELDGAIIMGTGFQPKALVATARALCRVLAVFFGWEHRSKLVANLSFLGYNRGLEGRTPQDWLNRDQAEVDKYRADERCMFTFTLNAYYGMFTGILRLYDPAVLAGMPKDLPLLFLAGDADPVGERTAGVRRAIQSLRDAGVRNIESKFYPGARHELLVETNKAEVFADIAGWLEKQLHP